jgi:hypothetical protein
VVDAALARALVADAGAQSSDATAKARALAVALRDKMREAQDLKERLAALNAEINDIQHAQLVDLMQEAGTDHLGLPAQGNLPACDAKMRPYYHANIAADWEPEKRQAAHDWLEREGHGDILKATVRVQFGRRDLAAARELEAELRSMGLHPDVQVDVPWSTLTAWLKEQVEKYHRTPPLDLLGAKIGSVVKITERRE